MVSLALLGLMPAYTDTGTRASIIPGHPGDLECSSWLDAAISETEQWHEGPAGAAVWLCLPEHGNGVLVEMLLIDLRFHSTGQ